MELCGLIKTDSADVVEIISREKGGMRELLYNNEPFGIVSMYGFKELKVKDFDKTTKNIKDGVQSIGVNPIYASIYGMIANQSRGEAVGVVLLEDGLLVIKSIFPFEAVKQPFKLGTADNEQYRGYVDIGDLDEDSEDFVELMELFEVC